MLTLSFAWVFIIGLIVGSFLNCLIWRLYKNETLGGRSYCPRCRSIIAWYDNIPLLSFFLLKGRCRRCHEKISWQYPLVEFVTGSLFLVIFQMDRLSPDFSLLLMRDWFLVITLVIIFVYDFRWQLVPMMIVWPMSLVILILNLSLGIPWVTLVFFGALGTIFFYIQYFLTKKRGLGEGDIWLGLLLGLAFPDAGSLLLIMVVSYGVGAIASLILLWLRKKNWQSRIALGPFLALGAIITLIWGERIINWYLQLFS